MIDNSTALPEIMVTRMSRSARQVAAANFRQLVKALNERWPGIDEVLMKTAVAIDGQIYQDAFLEPIQPSSEVFFMQRIEGG